MSRRIAVATLSALTVAYACPASASPGERPAGERVVAAIERVSRTLRETRYQAKTIVNARRGIYRWDCSGMTAWILSRSAPRALGTIGIRRPRARDFARTIAAAPVRGGRGWRRVERVADVLPGDVFAWERGGGRAPEAFLRALAERHLRRRRYVTGHVGFVIGAPTRVTEGWLVRVADSTSIPHDGDSRAGSGVTGFGTGTILLLEGPNGTAGGVGWAGLASPWVRRGAVAIGRALF